MGNCSIWLAENGAGYRKDKSLRNIKGKAYNSFVLSPFHLTKYKTQISLGLKQCLFERETQFSLLVRKINGLRAGVLKKQSILSCFSTTTTTTTTMCYHLHFHKEFYLLSFNGCLVVGLPQEELLHLPLRQRHHGRGQQSQAQHLWAAWGGHQAWGHSGWEDDDGCGGGDLHQPPLWILNSSFPFFTFHGSRNQP